MRSTPNCIQTRDSRNGSARGARTLPGTIADDTGMWCITIHYSWLGVEDVHIEDEQVNTKFSYSMLCP